MTFASTLLPMPAQTLALSRYDVACRAVAEAKAVDDIVEIVGQANAVHAYARQAKDRQMEIDAAEIRIRAERRLGELMAAQKATVGVATGGQHGGRASKIDGVRNTPSNAPPTLAEAGIDKNLAKRARTYALSSAYRIVCRWESNPASTRRLDSSTLSWLTGSSSTTSARGRASGSASSS